MMSSLLLTLELDQTSFTAFDTLRRQYFPPARNNLQAHITMFHALPGSEEESVCDVLQTVASTTAPIPLDFPSVWLLEHGVAITVHAPALHTLHQSLTSQWLGWLGPQHLRPYQPHVTIQNKVPPAQAQELYTQLADSWIPCAGFGEGIMLWRYLEQRWTWAQTYSFTQQMNY